MILGKYNQAKTITFDLFEVDGIDLSVAATFAAGDVKIMKDEGAEVNTTNLPTDEGSSYSLVLTATEMSAARIRIILIDQTATKVWLDTTLGLETYGNASAEHAFDLDTASQVVASVTAAVTLPTIPSNWITAAGINASALNGKGDWNIGKTGYTVSTVSDKTGYSLTQAFPTNFSDMAITVTTGQLTVGTNNDKAGYSISGTKTTLDALNDIAATAIVSGGAINTTTGAVDTVTTCTTTTTNTDMVTEPPTATQNADALLNRDMSAVSDTTARSPLNALRFIRNKWSVSGTTLTVTKEDDTTSAWTATVSTDAAADPITGNDPA